MKRAQRIYLDACCLNRPFDDQAQERVHMETEAIEAILLHAEQGDWHWVGSEALMYEVRNLADVERKGRIVELLGNVREWMWIGEKESRRSVRVMALGFKPLDALHIACAEEAGVDVLLTTDDRLLRNAQRQAEDLGVRVANPLRWMEEQIR
jgi:predicted nucleic acid-binding protein